MTSWTVNTGLLLSSISPWICSNSCPLSQWCYLTMSYSDAPFSDYFNLPASKVFSSKSALHSRWPKYCSFSFSNSPSNEDSGLIYFRMDWFDFPAVQGTLKSLLQQYKWKTSILHSAFFMVQLSHLYVTTGKTIALSRLTFVGKVMPLLFNMQWFWNPPK